MRRTTALADTGSSNFPAPRSGAVPSRSHSRARHAPTQDVRGVALRHRPPVHLAGLPPPRVLQEEEDPVERDELWRCSGCARRERRPASAGGTVHSSPPPPGMGAVARRRSGGGDDAAAAGGRPQDAEPPRKFGRIIGHVFRFFGMPRSTKARSQRRLLLRPPSFLETDFTTVIPTNPLTTSTATVKAASCSHRAGRQVLLVMTASCSLSSGDLARC